MRLSTRGVHWLDVSLSISYDPNCGSTRALLHGCTKAQQYAIKSQIEAHPVISTEHPLFLPVALLAIKRKIICNEEKRLWGALVKAEMLTGVTGAPLIGYPRGFGSVEEDDINDVTKDVIGVIQLATCAEKHAKTLLTVLEALRKCIPTIQSQSSRHENVRKAGDMLLERLDFIAQKTQILIFGVQETEKRAQAQLSAVRWHLDRLLVRKVSES